MKKFFQSMLFAFLIPFTIKAQGFKTVGSELHDANDHNFIIKGMNVPLAWYTNQVNSNISGLKTNTNVNTLRLVVQTTTPDKDWQTCVQNCIDNKIIPMVELHDVTGSTSATDLQKMATFWASKASFFTKPEIARYILINIANEWGPWQYANPTTSPLWKDTYNACVKTLRDAGIKTTIVIDAPGYGQDGSGKAILNNAISMINADPQKNLLFSVHMYCEWAKNGNSKIATDLPAIKAAGIPIIVGEFGFQEGNGNGGVCDIDESLIISTCESKGIGWLAWSISGNSGGEEFLDLSSDFAGKALSAWGNTVVNGANGTKTAVNASVFTITSTGKQSTSEFAINPNPASTQVQIVVPESGTLFNYSVVDFSGVTVGSGSSMVSTFEVDMSGLPAGIYLVKVWSDQNVFIKKIVKSN